MFEMNFYLTSDRVIKLLWTKTENIKLYKPDRWYMFLLNILHYFPKLNEVPEN